MPAQPSKAAFTGHGLQTSNWELPEPVQDLAMHLAMRLLSSTRAIPSTCRPITLCHPVLSVFAQAFGHSGASLGTSICSTARLHIGRVGF